MILAIIVLAALSWGWVYLDAWLGYKAEWHREEVDRLMRKYRNEDL